MTLEPYSFCFLRYHQNPLTGEFANIGVLLWAPKSKFLGFRASDKYSRMSHFFGGFDSEDYRGMISRVGSQFGKVAKAAKRQQMELSFSDKIPSAREIAETVIPRDDGALRWSPSFGGMCDNPNKALEKLYFDTIDWFYHRNEDSRRDERAVYREVYRAAFENPIVRPFIREHTIKAPLVSHDFKHAWKNGKWNVYEVISFDYRNAGTIQDNALRWGHRAELLQDSPEKAKLHFLLGNPGEGHRKAYSNAKDILARSGAELIEEHDAAAFSEQLKLQINRELSPDN